MGHSRMGRSRSSAKQAGTKFERLIADTLAWYVDDRIDRRVRGGGKDKGDIAGLRVQGKRVVIEAKNCARPDLAGWAAEAATERENDEALAGIIVHKRFGKGGGLQQWVTMEMSEFIALLTGERPQEFNRKAHGDQG